MIFGGPPRRLEGVAVGWGRWPRIQDLREKINKSRRFVVLVKLLRF